MESTDTICALSTGSVNAPLSVIRMSGPRALEIARFLFRPGDKISDRYSAYGSIYDHDVLLDDVILTAFHGPASFTGEDMVEISCHGNTLVVKRIMDLLFRNGCRMAEPGEFSKRSFINGKIDLTEAEAINHIITARSDWEIDTALRQMHGSFRDAVTELRKTIIHVKADLETGIDFTEEDIQFIENHELMEQLQETLSAIGEMKNRCSAGNRLARGLDLAIIGLPNVGKSSMLNMILNEERAIVSDIPGTTRDIIRESVILGGVPVNIIDTAGIGITSDQVEQLGIEQSYKKIESASLLLMVFDATRPLHDEEKELWNRLREKKVIPVINKIDRAEESYLEQVKEMVAQPVLFSAKQGKGLQELEKEVQSRMGNELVSYQSTFIADMRVLDLLDRALGTTREALDSATQGDPPEIVASSLNELLATLGEITGQVSPDDVLDSIFSRFCIGK